MRQVLFLEPEVKHYRVPFLLELEKKLRGENIQFKVAYGQAVSHERAKQDQALVAPPLGVQIRNVWLLGGRALWQRAWREVMQSDLVIVDQGNKNLINYPLLLLSQLGLKKVAFFGHGWNRRKTSSRASEWVKRLTLNWVNGWFAYTEGTRDYLIRHGVPGANIFVVNNSIDTAAIRRELDSISAEEVRSVRASLGISDADPVALYCGGLFPEKRIDVLLEVARVARGLIPGFHLIIVGTGQDLDQMKELARDNHAVKFVGPKFGREKSVFFKASDVFVHPGSIGLAVLDAFAAGLPVLTSDFNVHSPEIEYLVAGKNGMQVPCDAEAFANELVRWYSNPALLEQLRAGARASAEQYGVEAMADRFRRGILQLLDRR